MTTIVGVENADGCIIASDSRIAESGKVYTHPKMIKAIERGSYIIGGAGDYRALQVVLHGWQPPLVNAKAKQNLYEFVINKVAPSLKATLSEAGIEFNKSSDNDDDKFDLSLLIGINGSLFEIDSDFAVAMNDSGLYAIGSGGDYALGALHAGAPVLKAMEIAALNNNGTSAPFHILKQENKQNAK
jgi:ATP-dependent protease HslVU (ClpYQ) peptidase subunit